ncbi:stigma-specific STIG1-like protein 2 [Salvia hispanica]|uniref:stigma-specific STIG1-like protein 2 n=1 Tax=Salvia hispanica TaxID=49212 RepID=UPI00200921F2|nr:stigma-specific STIG1-like protein 2 [Salvia hispanica]
MTRSMLIESKAPKHFWPKAIATSAYLLNRLPTIRISRFLKEKERNPRAADHCHKDNDVCNNTLEDGRNATCCNNKCFDLQYDNKNCGSCKKKCALHGGGDRPLLPPLDPPLLLAYDKRHCGACNQKCMDKGLCVYGMCSYA